MPKRLQPPYVGGLAWLALSLFVAWPVAAQDITSNLRGHWKLVETSGVIAVDSSPTPHNGTYTNGVLLANSTPVPVDGAVAANFDGVNDYVAVPTESYFDITGAITVAAWIKVDVWDVAWQAIVTKGSSSWCLLRDGINGGVTFAGTGLSTVRVSTTVAVNDGKWHHIAGQYSGGYLLIYVDGVLNNWVAATGAIAVNNFPVEIGRNAESAGTEFDGAIYDVRVYNRGLSPTDISYLALQGGPVGAWKLNHAAGTSVTDSSIFANHGTVGGGANWSTRCNGTGLFDFNGSTHYISIPNAAQLQPWGALTIAGWIRADTFAGAGTDVDTILRKGDVNPNNFALAIANGRVELLLDGNDSSGIVGSTVLLTGVWYHVAATWDGATARIYVNGVLDNTPVARSGSIGADIRELYIGGRSGADLFDGTIQEVYLYNRALSQSEVARLAGLPGHWKFSEGAGTTAADTSGGGNNATLISGATWVTDCAGNKALQTDGIGGVAQTATAFAPPDEGTVSFWMQPAAGTTLRRICGLGGDWEIRHAADGTLVFDICGEGGASFCTTEPLDEAGRWYHVAVTFNSADDTFAVYVDGALHNSGTNVVNMVKQPAGILTFGTRTGTTEYWQGALRDFRVYNRRLCAGEIAELYGLVGHWKLDETSGTTVADSSGLGTSGTLTGTVAWTTGAIDGAHQFNYVDGDDYVTIDNSKVLDDVQENSYSLAAWFKPLTVPPGTGSANNAHYAIVAKPGYHTALFYSNSRTFEFSHVLTGNQSVGAGTWPVTYATGVFYHVAGVLDRLAGTIKIYVNGELKYTGAFTAGTAAREYGTLPWRLGSTDPAFASWRWPAHGVIDDARIYNRALCAAEIQALHAGGNPFQGVRILQWVETR